MLLVKQESTDNDQSVRHQLIPRTSQFNVTALIRSFEKFLKDLFSVLQIVPVSVINDDKVFDLYALIDPGSTGTYILDHITKTFNLKTSETFDLDVQFLF